MDVLVAKNIKKTYIGVQALDDINFTIRAGEVRCLVGENGSGKSTFTKIIAGVESPDSGEIYINGKLCTKHNARTAIDMGVQVIYQDLSLFGNMSVAENISMNKLTREKRKVVSKKEIHELATSTLKMIGVSMDLNAKVQGLSIANRQIIAICRALALEAKILFMDEPTTALTQSEIKRLLTIVDNLREKGLATIFISHKLDEVMAVADSATVLRDGKQVADMSKDEITKAKLTYFMTGREIEYPRYVRKRDETKPIIGVKNLSKEGYYKGVSFDVRPGDILGITGLLGSGRTELMLSLFGLNPPDSGEIILDGESSAGLSGPVEAVAKGIALVPEERVTQGLFLTKDLTDNVSAVELENFTKKMGILDTKRQLDLAEETIERFGVRIPNPQTLVKTLSGGNQQKVAIGKWVALNPKLLILDCPTVGVDIGSKAEIYELIHELANEGKAVIIVSDEIEEIVANANRVLVMYKGSIVKSFEEDEMKGSNISEEIEDYITNLDSDELEGDVCVSA